MKHSIWRTSLVTALTVVILLGIWQVAAVVMGIPIILPEPVSVLREFLSFFSNPESWVAIGVTVVRALRSFLIIMVSGLILGLLGGQSRIVSAVMRPVLSVIKATPVMAIILLAFIWFKTGTVPVFSAFLMGFPVLYQNMLVGMEKRDAKLIQMSRVYGLDRWQSLIHITIPSMLPFIIAGAKGALGMTWKVVIAAEVLTVPKHGVGSAMQYAQINLETATVMGWTLVAILLNALSDLIFDGGVRIMRKRRGGEV